MEDPRSPGLRADGPRAGEGTPAARGRRQSSPDSVSNSRRNERERNRVKMVNMGFSNLQRHVPRGGGGKRMSKVDTLRSAVDYIRRLEVLLREQGPGGKQRPPTSTTGSASASPTSSCGDTSGDSISSEHDFTAYKGWLGIE